MAYTVVPQKSMIEVHSMHRFSQADINFGASHHLHKRALIPFSFSPVGCTKQSDLERNGKGATFSVVMCKRQQMDCVLDSNSEASPQERKSNIHVMGIETKPTGRASKRAYPSKVSPDGPFVENEEMTNNENLQNFCRRGKLLDGAKIVEVMTCKNQIPHFPSCIRLIRGLIHADQIDRAAKVLHLMVMTGGTPDVITYNMLIGGLCRKKHLDVAVDVLESMSMSGCPPDINSYNKIIRAMCYHGKFDEAIQFWKDQLRKGCLPHVITFTILIQLVGEHFGVKHALDTIDNMALEGCYPDLITYNSLINLTCQQGNYEDAMLIIDNLFSRGMKPNVVTYNTLLHSLCTRARWDAINEILLFMNETSNPPTVVTYNTLINGMCKHGLLDLAIDFLDQMVSHGHCPDIITYNTLLRALCKEMMSDEAAQILYRLENANCSPTSITYNIVVNGLAKQGSIKKLMELCEHMIERGHLLDDVTYRCLVWAFCWADLIEEAVHLLKGLSANSRRMIRRNCYRFIIHRLCEKKKFDAAAEAVEMLISSRIKQNQFHCANVVKGLHAAGMVYEAMELRQKLIKKKLFKE